MTEARRGRALVVGGGIAGLAAAVALLDGPFDQVEVREASNRLGGKIATSPFAGLDHVDEGPDAFLRRVPHGMAFAGRVGVDDTVSPTDASALVWHDGLHPIPGGLVLGLPAEIRPFVTTSLLSWRGKARAALEPLLPRRDHGDALGALVRHRFGDEVHERLVDALVGSIYAADTDHWSLATVPQLAGVADAERSLLVGARKARKRIAQMPGGPIFATPRDGLGAMVAAAERTLAAGGARLRTGTPVASLERHGAGWVADGDQFDAVVVSTPPAATAKLLATVAPEAAEAIGTIGTVDVVMVRLAVDPLPVRLHGHSGYLVPKPDQELVTAASFASQKWAHWRPEDGREVLRISLGRDGLAVSHLDDDRLLDAAVTEVGRHIGVDLTPSASSLTRWNGAFPQYRPGHPELVAAAERALPAGLAVAGAAYHGIGIPACIAGAQAAAGKISETMPTGSGSVT